jgi:hypothetical protein
MSARPLGPPHAVPDSFTAKVGSHASDHPTETAGRELPAAPAKKDESEDAPHRPEMAAAGSQVLKSASLATARPVIRRPEELRLHRALLDLELTSVADELNEAARLSVQVLPGTILITTSGIILSGIGLWRSALLEGTAELHCIEYSLSDEESLQFILRHQKPRRGWNSFIRIRLALTLEAHFQQQALQNMKAGGRYKGLANLPEAQFIDVRQRIAEAAGVGARNVSKVKSILRTAHPRLIAAVTNDVLSIDAAMRFCKLPKAEQVDRFLRHLEDRETGKIIRRSVGRLTTPHTCADVITVLDTLHQEETRRPGAVVVRLTRLKNTVVLLSQDFLGDKSFTR